MQANARAIHTNHLALLRPPSTITTPTTRWNGAQQQQQHPTPTARRRGRRRERAPPPTTARAGAEAERARTAPQPRSSSSSSNPAARVLLVCDEEGSGPAFRLGPAGAARDDDGARKDKARPSYSSSSSATLPGQQQLQQQQLQRPPVLEAARRRLASLFLPDGFPVSVSPDYLSYQLWTIPVHITGWCGNALVTSSLLRAVGVGAMPGGAAGAAASAAAIKWLTKDGVGALGRLLVGSRLGREFDDDPRRWRMAAEALTSLGLALEVATALAPSQFLLLASAGTFARAVGKGMGNPVFRVVLTHFAAEGDNVGAVSAKEEVWEVSAQMAGFACSVALLQGLQGVVDRAEAAGGGGGGGPFQGPAGGAAVVCAAWLVLQSAHVGLRWNALRRLRFRELSHKRAAMLAAEHVAAVAAAGTLAAVAAAAAEEGGERRDEEEDEEEEDREAGATGGGEDAGSTALSAAVAAAMAASASSPPPAVRLSGVDALTEREPMLLPAETAVRPRVAFGRGPGEVLPPARGWLGDGAYAAEWARMYAREDYVLAWRAGAGAGAAGEARVALKASNDGSDGEDAAAAQAAASSRAAASVGGGSFNAARHGASGGGIGGIGGGDSPGAESTLDEEAADAADAAEATAVDVSRARRRREGRAMVRALYQAAWLDRHHHAGGLEGGGGGGGPAPLPVLRESLRATRAAFPGFLRAAREAGWNVDTVLIKGGARWRVVEAAAAGGEGGGGGGSGFGG